MLSHFQNYEFNFTYLCFKIFSISSVTVFRIIALVHLMKICRITTSFIFSLSCTVLCSEEVECDPRKICSDSFHWCSVSGLPYPSIVVAKIFIEEYKSFPFVLKQQSSATPKYDTDNTTRKKKGPKTVEGKCRRGPWSKSGTLAPVASSTLRACQVLLGSTSGVTDQR